MKTKWFHNSNHYYLGDASDQLDKLPSKVFRAEYQLMRGIFLVELGDQFDFKHKIYGKDPQFVDWVTTTFDNTVSNLGVLFNGAKGTGKTVTAKLLANQLIKRDLPIILVADDHDGMAEFINAVRQPAVFFFDEYEKTVGDTAKLLSVMDGAYNSPDRKVFLLTTNELYVNSNLLQRPGRIRYVKSYGDMSKEDIEEIVDDMLEDVSFREDILNYISHLENISIDIVTAAVLEVNLHLKKTDNFKDFFNTKVLDKMYDVYEVLESPDIKEPQLYATNVKVAPWPCSKATIGHTFVVNGENLGRIVSVPNSTTVKTIQETEEWMEDPNEDPDAEDKSHYETRETPHTFHIWETYRLHRSFARHKELEWSD